jgi:DNA-binding response OmpR family regulator
MSVRVLVVEDDPPWRLLLRQLLVGKGYEVIEAEEGFFGAQRVIIERPDLVVLDLGLPHIDGMRVLEELKQRQETAGIPIVVVSGRDDSDTRRSLREHGGVRFVSKAADPAEILRAVEHELRGRTVEPGGDRD